MKRMTWITVWACLLTLAGCSEQHARNQMNAEMRYELARGKIHFRLAEEAFDRGNLKQCREQLSDVLRSDAPYIPAYLLAAKVAMRENRFNEAHDYLTVAAELAPEVAEAWYGKGLLDEQVGDIDSAIAAMKKAQQLEPAVPEYLLCLAELQVRRGEPDRALATLKTGEDTYASHTGVQSALADLYTMLGDDQLASRALRRIVRMNPDDAEVRTRLGMSLARCRRYDEAVPLLETAYRSDEGKSLAVRVALGECYLSQAQYTKAERVYASLCKDEPKNVQWNYHLAECYTMGNDDRAALERLDRVFTVAPNHATAHALAGYLYLARGEHLVAEEHLRVAIDRVDDPTLVAVLLTKALRAQGKQAAANECWAEFGGLVDVASRKGVRSDMAVVKSSSVELTGSAPRDVVNR
jgi:Tfp pilus assembly protein PilF